MKVGGLGDEFALVGAGVVFDVGVCIPDHGRAVLQVVAGPVGDGWVVGAADAGEGDEGVAHLVCEFLSFWAASRHG